MDLNNNILDIINDKWGWIGVKATRIINTNDFGNIIFKNEDDSIWRIIPEELECNLIAENIDGFSVLKEQHDFIEDWKMTNLVTASKKVLGELNEGQKYCLKLSPVLGGVYEKDNLGVISHEELIAFSGELAFKIKDLPDGANIKLDIVNE